MISKRHYLNPNILSFPNNTITSIWWNPKMGLRVLPSPKYQFQELTFRRNTLDIKFLSNTLNKNIVKTSANIFHDYSKSRLQENVTRFLSDDYIHIWCPNPLFESNPNDEPKLLINQISLLDIYIKYASRKYYD